MSRNGFLAFMVVALTLPGAARSAQAAPATGMFWGETSPNQIGRADLNPLGSGQTLLTGDSTHGVAVDEAAGKLYWTDLAGSGRIRRANLDGSNVETLINDVQAVGIAVDSVNQKVYWTEHGDDIIGRADLDGSNAETVLSIDQPWGIALDVASGKLYFSQTEYFFSGNMIQRVNLDGSGGVEHVVNTNGARYLDLDLTNGHIYWAEQGNLRIMRSGLDGSGKQTFLSTVSSKPRGIAVDSEAEQVYFTDINGMVIERVNFDGSGRQLLVDTSTASPQDIDLAFVIPEPTSLVTMLGVGGLLMFRRRHSA